MKRRYWWIPLLISLLPTLAGEWVDDLRTRRKKR